jgi:hypothetical protein
MKFLSPVLTQEKRSPPGPYPDTPEFRPLCCNISIAVAAFQDVGALAGNAAGKIGGGVTEKAPYIVRRFISSAGMISRPLT